MKRKSILFLPFLVLTIWICCGCSSSDKSASPESKNAVFSAAFDAEETAEEEKPSEDSENVVDVTGIFKRLEDNHTAIFSFDGVETVFYFDDPAVQEILFEAVIESSYTFSYRFDPDLGLNVIYEITES